MSGEGEFFNGLMVGKLKVTGNVESGGSLAGKTPVVTLAATRQVKAEESGTTFFLAHATEFVTTLPAPAAGLKYKFVCKIAPAGANYTVVTSGSANLFIGFVVCHADGAGATVATAGDTISFVGSQAIVGDWVEVECDGTSWYVTGMAGVAAGVTITAAS
jgi:hypothetical protein